jgi:predicted dehydrogenase
VYKRQALQAGCDAISEKPLTTTAENVRAILAAERDSGRCVQVTFNARYAAYAETIYQFLRDGAIGALISVDFAEFLDTDHGADYFRRWHRRKANSGGLQIHKASHHFDQLNWWIGAAAPGADPESVYALGARRFFGPTRAERGERCLTCAYTATCSFYLDLNARAELQAQYLQAEYADGYYRDRCVFADEIDIEDTLVVALRCSNGVLVNYSLNAFAPYEGQRIGFNGSKGRLEVDLIERYHGLDEQGALRVLRLPAARAVRVSPLFGRPYEVPFEAREGGHGGADVRLRQHLFRPEQPDPLGQRADARAGALSVLIGAAVNQSIASDQAVRVAELLQGV